MEKEQWPQAGQQDTKFEGGMNFTGQPPGVFNSVDDYLDMDDALQSYLTSLGGNSIPQTVPYGDGAAARSKSSKAIGDNGAAVGKGAPMFIGGEVAPGVSPRTIQGGGGSGPFVFTGEEESGYGGRGSSESGSGGAPARQQRKRREENEPEERSAEKKQQVMQEKNRLAQRRFRERQKAKVHGLHKEIEDLRSTVENLQLENGSLQSQNGILQKVLAMRDEQIRVMQESSKQLLEAAPEADVEGVQLARTTVTLSELRKGSVMRITADNLKKMTPEEVIKIWQDYVTEISSALVEASSDGDAEARIEKLINEVCMLCMRFAVLNPVSCKMWTTRQYHLSEAEELKRWQSVITTLDMSKTQKEEIVALRKMLLQKLQQLVEERRQLNMTIQTTLPSSTVGHRIDLEYLKANQAVVRLKEILRSEHNAMLDFVGTIVKKVLKPIQVARLMVQAYPSKPDVLAVASAVAIDCGVDVMVLPEPMKPIPFLPSGAPNPETNLLEGQPGPMAMGYCQSGAGLSEDASSTLDPNLNVPV
ncbi:unnamed protein product [Ostreobium quekettii]|uniref:BZIP domain-containing protein n=1 Tax=Ostreobium quekettii TaxID=121088 RepID=A0A8S1IRC5_9CHLO|nr:unnamed protein product [Ostreobium quekettii]